MSQERTSYLPKEIMWGHRFNNIVEYDQQNGVYVADYDKFDETESVIYFDFFHAIREIYIFLFIRLIHHYVVQSY